MSRSSTPFRWVAIAFAIAVTPRVIAHAGHDQLLRVDVEEDAVRLSLSVDGKMLGVFDDNADGKLSKKEFLIHSDAISAWLDERITIVGKDHAVANIAISDLPITNFEEFGDADDVGKIHVLRTCAIGTGDGAMMLRFNLFDHHHTVRNYDMWRGGKLTGGILTLESNVISF